MPTYETSALWRKTLAPQTGDYHEKERTRLRAAYETFWERSVALARTIAHDLPGLTLHDDAHFSALWHRTSLLVGDNHDINPLEAFVLGGAILLHDTGHAIKAYEGGRGEIEATNEYCDALVSLLRRSKDGARPTDDEIAHPDQSIANAALFSALRVLHAKLAKSLLQRQFGDRYLLDDSDLRENLGEIIGQIAASHQDDRNNLPMVLPPTQNAPGYMPAAWTIRPVYLACLLRCADAIQIDQTRAPPFLMGLQNPSKISRLHWLAQKKLGQPSVPSRKNGPGALVFTSQGSFCEAEADAWWVAYDLIQVANTELAACNDLLLDENLPGLAVDRVLDAERPDKLAQHVRASGWAPINAEVRAADVKKIIKLFGGHALYGRNAAVPLRELIQNAADAIRARRTLDKNDFLTEKSLSGFAAQKTR